MFCLRDKEVSRSPGGDGLRHPLGLGTICMSDAGPVTAVPDWHNEEVGETPSAIVSQQQSANPSPSLNHQSTDHSHQVALYITLAP